MRNISAPAPSLTRRKLYISMVTVSQLMWAGQSYASPEGAQVVGGAGKIDQSGKETVIHQQTDRMAIDWQSFDVKADERVQFVQPSASSLALNRVVSNKGSQILGRIDANGQVLLVNPNGVVFGKDSQINVGGILASGLSINPTDFMNGNFTLSEVEGAAGKVVNSGIINAATGGSVTLLGKEVTNEGLIIANLGAVNLAVGKEAVVTFENNGLVGVKVTKEVLQNELGVDAALINSGEINAEGGRILLTASTSQDIFSDAVNHEGMSAANSVVVNDDGSFTLGAGADVVNTGKISANSKTGDAGQIVVLGDKVTNSGAISADSQTGNGGHIELNSKDTTILNQTANVSAQSTTTGKGGDVKILGDKVGLMDTANVNASGANGGGQVLIGGDKTGKNQSINNANFIYLGENTNVKTDALLNGNGGKLITFAQDTARIYGNLSARGGSEGGNGGFIETSGLKGFEILNTPDITAKSGIGGTWLIDPYNLTITSSGSITGGSPFNSVSNTSTLSIDLLQRAMTNGSTVEVSTGTGGVAGEGDITLAVGIEYNNSKTPPNAYNNSSAKSTLILNAANDIKINANITRASGGTGNLSIELNANNGVGKSGVGSVIFDDGVKIETQGGNFSATGNNFTLTDNSSNRTPINTNGGNVSLTMTGVVNLGNNNTISTGGGNFSVGSSANRVTSFTSTDAILDTSSDTKGGAVSIYTVNDANLGSISFGRENQDNNSAAIGNIVVDSSAGNIELEGNYLFFSNPATPVATMTLNATRSDNNNFGKITLKNTKIDNDGANNSKLNLSFNAGRDITVNNINTIDSGIWLTGGNAEITSTNGKILINSNAALEYGALNSEGGYVRLSAANDIEIQGTGVTTGGGDFTVTNSANFTNNFANGLISTSSTLGGGDISITSSGDVTLGSLVFADSDTTANTQTRAGTVTVSAGGNVSLEKILNFKNAGNTATEQAALDITAKGNITLNKTITGLGGSSRDAFNINLTADNDNSGLGNVIFSATSGDDIYTGGGNFTASGFGLTLNGRKIDTEHLDASNESNRSNGGNVTLKSSSDFSLGTIITDSTCNSPSVASCTGNLIIESRGSSNIAVSQLASTTLTINGTSTFNVGTGILDLDNAGNDFRKSVSVTNAGVTSIVDINAIALGASNVSGAFNVTSSGNITQSGKLDIANKATLNAGSGTITLTNAANDFKNGLSLGSNTGVNIFDINALVLDAFTVTGAGTAKVEADSITFNTLASTSVTTTGGVIDLNATAGDLQVGELKTSSTTAGTITLAASGSILLNGNLSAVSSAGVGQKIDLKNNVKLNNAVVINTSGSGTNARGDVSFSGIVTSTSNSNLNITGKTITFSADVGDATTNRLGALTINSTDSLGSTANKRSFYATSFNFTADNIFANVLDSLGGAVTLKGTNAVTVNEISAQGVITNQSGGNVTVDGADITLGNLNNTAVNSSGNGTGLAGDIKITATENGTPSIILKGNINSGAKVAALTLAGTGVTDGKVDLSGYTSLLGFTSSLLVTGSTGVDTITGNSNANTWDLADGVIKKTSELANSAAPIITYTGFTNVSGGSLTDIFDIANSFAGSINGGDGDDTFNIIAGTALTANLTGGNGTDLLKAFTTRQNVWSLGGATESLNTTLTFSGIENLDGGNLKDTFTITGTRGGVIDAGTGAEDDIVRVDSDMTIDFTQADIKGIQNAEIIQNTGGAAIKLFTTSAANSSVAWKIWDFDLVAGADADGTNDGDITFNGKTIKFVDFSTLVGGAGNDAFTFEGAAAVTGLIDGGTGTNNSLNLSSATGNRKVEIASTVGTSDITVTRLNAITGNSSTNSTLFLASASGSTNTWVISGANDGSINGITFTDFNNLTGGDGADIFDFSSGGGIGGNVSGGANTNSNANTIIARTGVNNTWAMTGNNSGSLIEDAVLPALPVTYVNNFLNIQNFKGANADTMDFSGFSGLVKIDLGTGVSGASGITTFIGNYDSAVVGSSAEITGPNSPNANDWQITGANKGSIESTVGGVATLINFEKFNILIGGSGNDDFTIASSGSVTGSISGGTNGTDTLTRTASTAIAWVLDTATAKAGSMGTTLFSNIDSIFGSGLDSLTGRNQANDWTLSGDKIGNVHATGNTSDQITFSGINKVIGLSAIDAFDMTSADALSISVDGGTGANNKLTKNFTSPSVWIIDGLLTGTLDGNRFANISEIVGTNDTLTGRNQANDWTLTGNKSGNVHLAGAVTTDQITFSGINKVIGLAGSDTFTLTSANALSITVDGGGTGNKLVRNYGGSAIWQLDGARTGKLGAMTFSNIGEITGNNDTLIGQSQANNWLISGAGLGTVAEDIASPTDTMTFGGMNTLIGNVLSDKFVISASGSIGSARGGAGTGENSLTSNLASNNFAMAGSNNGLLNSTTSFDNIQKIIGGSAADTLTGSSSASTWIFNTANTLKINTNANQIEFSGIEKVQGGDGVDTFDFSTSYVDIVDGGNEADIFNVYTTVKNLLGGNGDDKFNLFANAKVESINGGGNSNTITGPTGVENTWLLVSANKGSMNKSTNTIYVSSFESIQTLQGSGSDSLTGINQGNIWTLSGENQGVLAASNNSNTISFSGMNKLIGGTGSDYFDFSKSTTSAITGSVDGGSTAGDNNNTLKGRAGKNSWIIESETSGQVKVFGTGGQIYVARFLNIQTQETNSGDGVVSDFWDLSKKSPTDITIEGTNSETSKLIGYNENNNWTISSANGGTVNYSFGGNNVTVTFSGFANLNGGTKNDAFRFVSGGSISGTVNGGSNDAPEIINSVIGIDDGNSWRMTGNNSGNVTVGAASTPYAEFTNIKRITGGNKVDVLYGIATGDSTTVQNWRLGASENIFFTTDPTVHMKFMGMENIEGGIGSNTLINSVANKNWVLTSANHGTVDSIIFSKINTIQGSGTDSITGRDQENNWQITGTGLGSVSQNNFTVDDTFNFSGMNKLIGGTGLDIFTFGALGTVKDVDGGSAVGDINNTIVSKERANTWVIEPNGASKLYASANSLDPVNFVNISHLTGGEFIDNFDIANVSVVKGILDGGAGAGANTFDLTKIVNGTNVTVGVGDTATADIKIKNITQLNANGNNSNTLVADNIASNTFKVTGANSGKLNSSMTFTGFANLMGRDFIDNFVFEGASARLTGVINGGTGADKLDLLLLGAKGNVAIMTDGLAVKPDMINITNVEILNASTAFVNTLTANDKKNTWAITAANNGTLSTEGITTPIAFSNFSVLIGGQKDDLFEFSQAGKLDGYIDGGAHDTADVVDLSKLSGTVDIKIGNLDEGYRRIEKFIGNNADSTLFGDDNNNIWNLTGINSGNVNDSIFFAGFTSLVGGKGDDTFHLLQGQLNGSVSGGVGNDTFNISNTIIDGTLNGETGDDILNATISNDSSESIRFIGGGDTNTVNVLSKNGDTNTYLATHGLAVAGGGTLRYDVNSKTHNISYSNVKTVNDLLVADSLTIDGTDVADVFALSNNSYLLNNLTTVNYQNKNNLIVAGSANDKVLIAAPINIPNFLTLKKVSVETTGNGVIRANGLLLDGAASVGSASNRLQTNIANLSVNTSAGDIYINELSGLNISGFTSNNKIDLALDGNLTSDVPLASIAQLNISTTGNITLDKDNALTGELNLKTNKNIILKNSTGTTFGNVSVDVFNVDSLGSILGNGIVTVGGIATLASGLDITLQNAQNDFSSVSVTNAQNVSLVDSNLLTLSTVGATGNVKTQSQGIILNGAVNGGSLSIGAGAGVANLANTVTAQSMVDVVAQSIIVAGNIDAKAGIKANTSGEFSQAANISGGSVDLNVGRYTANSGTTAATNGSVSINSTSDIATKNITASNDIILKAANDVTVGGALSTTTGKVDLLAGRNAILNNDVNGQSGANITATTGSVQLQALLASAKGDVTVVTPGDVAMGAGASAKATEGNISYTGKNLTVTALSALNGAVTFKAGEAVVDANAMATNISAKMFVVDSMSGIGALDDIETAVSGLSLSNQSGNIRITNTGKVVVDRLRTNGNIAFSNTIGDVVLDNRKNALFSSVETDSLLAGGTVNSNYTVGNLNINLKSGNLIAEPSTRLDVKNPDLTAFNATVIIDGGEFGSITRPLAVYVQDTFFLNATRSWNPFWGFDTRPRRVENISTLQGSLSDLLSAGAEQLVEVEELNEINPAIFTNVRNYVYDDVAIMLPADQRYEENYSSTN